MQLLVLLRQLHQGAGQQAGALQGIVHHLLEVGVQPRQRAGLCQAAAAQGPLLCHIVIDRRQQQAALVAKGGIEAAGVQAGCGHQLLHGGLGIAFGAKGFHGVSQDGIPIVFGAAHGVSGGKVPRDGKNRAASLPQPPPSIHVECLLKKYLHTNQKTS